MAAALPSQFCDGRDEKLSSSSQIATTPTFCCSCCGKPKVEKTRRSIGSDAVAVAACLDQGFVEYLNKAINIFPILACRSCYEVAKRATDMARWCFPNVSAFAKTEVVWKCSEAQVCPSLSAASSPFCSYPMFLCCSILPKLAITAGVKTLRSTLDEILARNSSVMNLEALSSEGFTKCDVV